MLKETKCGDENEDFVFFWSGPFSNWHKSPFKYKGKKFSCAEQAMMYEKAMMFGDTENANKIMKTDSPNEQKRLGRSVKNYDDRRWAAYRQEIVTEILICKFRQNKELRELLLGTGKKILCEASPVDTIWGIGMAVTHPNILDKTKWNGQNLLGKALMDARASISGDTVKLEDKSGIIYD